MIAIPSGTPGLMKIDRMDPPREFRVGAANDIVLRHAANLALANDEMVTFTTASGTEYDVVRKSWGYYATPSLNGRLPRFRLRPALVRSTTTGNSFVMLVESGHEADFASYLTKENLVVLAWLDALEIEIRPAGQ